MASRTSPQLTLTLPPATLQLPRTTFSQRPSTHAHFLETLQNRMCDPLIVYHTCGHISEFSCSIGRSFQPGEVHEHCTFNVPSMEVLEGPCGSCIERGTVSSPATFVPEYETVEVERGIRCPSGYQIVEQEHEIETEVEEVVVPPQKKVRLRFLRGLRLKFRHWIFQVARVECDFSHEPQGLSGEYRDLVVAFGEEAEEIWVRARTTGKRIRGWALRVVREEHELLSDRELAGRLLRSG